MCTCSTLLQLSTGTCNTCTAVHVSVQELVHVHVKRRNLGMCFIFLRFNTHMSVVYIHVVHKFGTAELSFF